MPQNDKTKISKWVTLESENIGNYRAFSVVRNHRKSQSSDIDCHFYVLKCDDWVNVIPVTRDKKVVMIEQYRHGTDEITLEVPGGILDQSDSSPLVAAQRELREETGYSSEKWTLLGSYHPNPAIQSNLCHTFLAEDSHQVGSQALDGLEEIAIKLVSLDDIPSLILNGDINHAIIITAFHLMNLKRT